MTVLDRMPANDLATGSSTVRPVIPASTATRNGPPRCAASPTCAARRCWRTTTSCRPSRTSPTTSVTRWRCRGSPPTRPRTPSCSAACTSWPRRPRSCQPGQDRADPRPAGGLLAGRLDHRRRTARLEGRVSRRGRGVLRQHHGRGEGRDRHLLHVVERRRGGRLHPRGPRGAVLPGPVPRRPRAARHRPQEPARLGGRVPRARRHQRRRAGRPGARASRTPNCMCIPNAVVPLRLCTSPARARSPRTG